MIRVAIAVAAFVGITTAAGADDSWIPEGRAGVAQLATLSKLAPMLCSNVEVDDAAVGALLDRGGVTEHDVMDPQVFGTQDELAARSFAQSVKTNPAQSCADIASYLGPDGARLLRLK